ncbi:FAD-binding monooxygenase [Actinoalloteichus sp. AHMU CJ021]|uniref:FAD-dependent oxidoreductase n=1 Tax=Actinoalloteichus sp. AHMU CJ021 TaxID=2072503 RepID=UPI000CA060D2|nr:FAD-binding monooxygenase [Actinoalloteichus sp. AHMU CJ021]
MRSGIGARAVVLGGSITGLFAAAALAPSYREVVIVDRDRLVGVREWRRGAPQTRHINGLLARGHQALEELFPGITEEMADDGIPFSDLSGTVRWYFYGKRLQQLRGGLSCVAATRPMLEYHVRRRVEAMANVTFLEECDVVGLTTSPDRARVTGARIHRRKADSNARRKAETAEEVIEADLVIDTTGRGSRSPKWLVELGYQRVEEQGTKVGIGYASRHYKLTTDPFGKDHSINPVASPTLPRGAIFTKTDSGMVELTTYGILGDHPPTDPEGFNAFVKTLAAPEIHETISVAEPIDDIALFKFPTTMWRRYDLMETLPERLLIMGDAVCTPNPVYAQAQSLSALEALALRERLSAGRAPDTPEFQRAVADIIRPAWEMTTAVDLGFPGVEGERTPKVRMMHVFSRLLHDAATRDGRFTAAFMRVAGLVDPPTALQRPGLVLRVLRDAVGVRLSRFLARRRGGSA